MGVRKWSQHGEIGKVCKSGAMVHSATQALKLALKRADKRGMGGFTFTLNPSNIVLLTIATVQSPCDDVRRVVRGGDSERGDGRERSAEDSEDGLGRRERGIETRERSERGSGNREGPGGRGGGKDKGSQG